MGKIAEGVLMAVRTKGPIRAATKVVGTKAVGIKEAVTKVEATKVAKESNFLVRVPKVVRLSRIGGHEFGRGC